MWIWDHVGLLRLFLVLTFVYLRLGYGVWAWQLWWMQMLTLLGIKMSFFNLYQNVLFASDSWRLKKCNCTKVGRNFNFWVIFNLMNVGALEILKKRAQAMIARKNQNDKNLDVLFNECLNSSSTFQVLSISKVLVKWPIPHPLSGLSQLTHSCWMFKTQLLT